MISSIVTPARPLLLNKWRALLRMRSRVSGFWLGGCGTGNTSALWLDPRGCPPDVLEHLMRPAKLLPVSPLSLAGGCHGQYFCALTKIGDTSQADDVWHGRRRDNRGPWLGHPQHRVGPARSGISPEIFRRNRRLADDDRHCRQCCRPPAPASEWMGVGPIRGDRFARNHADRR